MNAGTTIQAEDLITFLDGVETLLASSMGDDSAAGVVVVPGSLQFLFCAIAMNAFSHMHSLQLMFLAVFGVAILKEVGVASDKDG